jgi:hypothetical protein
MDGCKEVAKPVRSHLSRFFNRSRHIVRLAADRSHRAILAFRKWRK